MTELNAFRELADMVDNINNLKEDNVKTKEEINGLKGAVQIINKEIRQVRLESQAHNMSQFLNTINIRVNDKLNQVTSFFVDVKKRVFPTEITTDMLKEVMERSGTKQKELADIIGTHAEDLVAVSKVINGHTADPYRKWLIYNYCNQKIKDIVSKDKSEVEL